MNQSIYTELQFFLISILWGAIILLVYDLLRILRRVVKHNAIILGVEDLIFWILTSLFIFAMIYEKNDGIIRGFSVIGVTLGMVLYHYIFSDLFVNVLTKLIQMLLSPFAYAIKMVKRFLHFVFIKGKRVLSFLIRRLKKQTKSVKIALAAKRQVVVLKRIKMAEQKAQEKQKRKEQKLAKLKLIEEQKTKKNQKRDLTKRKSKKLPKGQNRVQDQDQNIQKSQRQKHQKSQSQNLQKGQSQNLQKGQSQNLQKSQSQRLQSGQSQNLQKVQSQNSLNSQNQNPQRNQNQTPQQNQNQSSQKIRQQNVGTPNYTGLGGKNK